MDVRHIQVTGGSSYMVTLPKDWADRVGIRKNTVVRLQPQSDGSLVIYPEGSVSPNGDSVREIATDDIDDEDLLYRQLVGAYVSGIDIIVLTSENGLSEETTDTASRFVHTAIGMEITEDDGKTMTVEDLMDHKDIRPYKSVERMKVLTRNMINDVVRCLDTGSAAPISNLDAKDTEVDRLDWLISRQISILQRNVSLSREMGADLPEMSGCGNVSRCIERIGDHTVLVASSLEKLTGAELSALDGLVSDMIARMLDVFSDSVSIWAKKDMIRANDCIRGCQGLVRETVGLSEKGNGLSGEAAIALRMISGSIRRVAEYSMDISEVTINNAMSEPDSVRRPSE